MTEVKGVGISDIESRETPPLCTCHLLYNIIHTLCPSLATLHATVSPVDLIEWSCIIETALPHLIDDLLRVCLILDLRALHHR
jgi:hypothetical protein